MKTGAGQSATRGATLKKELLAAAVLPAMIWSGAAMAQSPSAGGATPDATTPTASGTDAPVAPSASPDATAASTDSSGTQLQEIVVTAQRRSQNLQEVPLAVTAFNAKTLQSSGVSNINDIAHVDPSINIGFENNTVIPFLRGVGNPSSTTIGNESSVPVYIDDVYYTRLSATLLELANVERVEVLKGPQGTLFGRNASGGAIQIFTRDPGKTEAFEATVGYSNYDTFSGKLYASEPLGDNGGIDLSISGRRQNDGWGRNLVNGNKTYQYNFVNIRSKLVYQLTPTTKVRIIGFYVKSYAESGNVSARYRGTLGSTAPLPGQPSQIVPPASNFYDTVNTVDAYYRTKGYGGSVKIDQELGGFAQATSITAYRKATESNLTDGDGTPQNFLLYNINSRDRQISEELQLKSKPASKFSWIVGAFYLDSRQGYLPTDVTGLALPPIPGIFERIDGLQRVKSLAGYGQATYPITDTTQLTLGARYTHDRVRGIGTVQLNIPGVGFIPVPGSVDYDKSFVFTKFTYRAAIDQQIAERVKAYASVSRGYKSGTFNTLPLQADPSKPETVDAYEVGLKSEFFDRRLRVNAAIFQNDIKSPQVETITTDPNSGASFIGLTNAKKARSRGAEINVDAVLAEGLSARIGATYLDAKYTNFKNAPFYYPIVNGACPNGGKTNGYAAGNCSASVGDASGNRLVQVPKLRLSGGIDYSVDTGAGKATLDVNAAYSGKFFWDADNILAQKSYTLVNGSILFAPSSYPNMSIRFYGNNITKRKYYSYELTTAGGSGSLAVPGSPRTYGVEIGFKI